MQIKNIRFATKMPKSIRWNNNVGENVKQLELSYSCRGNVNVVQSLKKTEVIYLKLNICMPYYKPAIPLPRNST